MYLSLSGSAARVPAFPRILGDVGGTNVRFALQQAAHRAPEQVHRFACQDFAGFSDALMHYQQQVHTPARAAAFGIANPVTGPDLSMTNHPWAFSIEEVRRERALEALLFLNDFTALSLGIPSLRPERLHKVGGGAGDPSAPCAILGPGTGLGVSGLYTAQGGAVRIPISGEGGHVTLAAGNDDEAALLSILRKRFGHVSAERVLSGQGLVLLYGAFLQKAGKPVSAAVADPAQVLELAEAGSPIAAATLHQFAQFLASVSGDLALTLGARGGVFLAGGISPRIQAYIDAPAFRDRFEAKGRFRSYLSEVPVWLIQDSLEPALLGASEALTRELA